MLNLIFRLFLTFNATSLFVIVYLVNQGKVLGDFCSRLEFLPDLVSYAVYFLIPILLTGLSILLSGKLSGDLINSGGVKGIEQANNSFMPSYLGYFFVALSVQSCHIFIFVYILIFLFTYLSQTHYFNPIFLLFRFNFYYLTTDKEIRIFLITRSKLRDATDLEFKSLKRINDFTFIEK